MQGSHFHIWVKDLEGRMNRQPPQFDTFFEAMLAAVVGGLEPNDASIMRCVLDEC